MFGLGKREVEITEFTKGTCIVDAYKLSYILTLDRESNVILELQ